MSELEKYMADAYNEAYEILDKIEDKIHEVYKKRMDDALKTAVDLDDILAIKESLRPMPNCASKALLFRSLIIIENKIKAGTWKTQGS